MDHPTLPVIEESASPMSDVIFHLAFPVTDFEETRQFYVDGLGCHLGRQSSTAMILELMGHQLVAHLAKEKQDSQRGIYPRHFGLIFKSEAAWQQLLDRAKDQGLLFSVSPRRRFSGSRLEHLSFFLEDPSHNLLEFKYYRYDSAIFGEQEATQVGETGVGPIEELTGDKGSWEKR